MFLRRSLASLARAYKLHVYDFFFYVGTFIPKSWLRYSRQLSLTKRMAKLMFFNDNVGKGTINKAGSVF